MYFSEVFSLNYTWVKYNPPKTIFNFSNISEIK